MSSYAWPSPPGSSYDGELRYTVDAYQRRLGLKQSIDKVVDAGISMQIDTPQVVVIGSQSSGKSSLFEGIAGVPLPRETGTCTRCPTVCRMSRKAGPWRCKIALMREVHKNGQSLHFSERIPFGADIFDSTEVCERILRAQAAILHPDVEPNQFLDIYNTEKKENGFSFDSILVDIEGPDVTDLSFVDLPGIIAMDDEDDENVKRVEALASKYIENDACLILLVFHCNDDLSNQGAGRLAKTFDPDAKRTIVVLTKPDLIEPGQEEPWKQKLRASDNCFCVRQPGRAQLGGITREQARQQEADFFQRGPWRDEYNEPSTGERLGTENLTNYLNIRLLDWIVDRLPQMQADLRRHLRQTQTSLSQLPASIDDPIRHANELVWRFGQSLSAATDIHNFKIPGLVGVCRRRLEEFVDVLLYHLFPRFCPFDQAKRKVSNPTDFDEFPQILPKISGLDFKAPAHIPVPATVYLDKVVERADLGRTREMPGNYPYGVLKEYMEASVSVWKDPTEAMLEDIFEHIVRALESMVSTQFGPVKTSGSARVVWGVVKSHIESRRDSVMKTLLDSMEREKTGSLIFGRSEYFHHKQAYYEHYRSQLHTDSKGDLSLHDMVHGIHTVSNLLNEPMLSAATGLAAAAVEELGPRKNPRPRHTLSEIEEHGITVMAQTRAFYHIAVRRYAEGAAQVVFHDLLLDLQGGPELERKLREEIGISGSDALQQCRKFVEPSQDTVRERNDLKSQQALLKEVLRDLCAFF